jgi:hypothetical protein
MKFKNRLTHLACTELDVRDTHSRDTLDAAAGSLNARCACPSQYIITPQGSADRKSSFRQHTHAPNLAVILLGRSITHTSSHSELEKEPPYNQLRDGNFLYLFLDQILTPTGKVGTPAAPIHRKSIFQHKYIPNKNISSNKEVIFGPNT